ncbi:MAG: metal ABC transporter permease [Corynebacterium sp.]|nr:metal ABC transporter permease [Corynebacterium sp.]
MLTNFFTNLSDYVSMPYIYRPLIMLIILGLSAGLIGVVINLRAAEFNAEACIHSIFPGIVIGALFYGVDQVLPFASLCGVVVAIALTLLRRGSSANAEAGTAIVLASFFGLGIIISMKKGDMSGQLEAIMFGRLLEVSGHRLLQASIVCLVAVLLILLSWRYQIAAAFEPEVPRSLWADLILNAAIAAVVVAASSAIGVLLVLGYLVIPGAAAHVFATSIRTMIPISMAVGIGGGVLGILLSYFPVSPQAVVALSMIAIFFILLIARKITDSLKQVRA